MLAEQVVLNEEGVVKLPEHLSFEEGATLPCAGVTAWHALIEHGWIKAGDQVLLQGTGGVSLQALLLARACGAEVFITSSSDEKLARAQALGAAHVINYKHEPEWEKKVVECPAAASITWSRSAVPVPWPSPSMRCASAARSA